MLFQTCTVEYGLSNGRNLMGFQFGEMDERLKKIERHCLQDDTEKCLLGSCKESPAAEG